MSIQSSDVNRSSIVLFSEQAQVTRLKLTLRLLLSIFVLLLLSELYFTGMSALAIAMITSFIILTLLYYWVSPDTGSVIAGMLLWSVAVFITYACWLGNGIFDTSVLAFPCLLMLAIVISSKLIFISLYVYLVGALCFFAVVHNQSLLTGAILFQGLPMWGRVFSYIIILTLFSVGVFLIFSDIRKRFKNILQKNLICNHLCL